MFFIILVAAFGLLAIHPKARYVCCLLCCLNTFLLIISLLCDKNGDALYLLRTIGTTAVAVLACIPRTTIGFYQAFIQLAILCSYVMLAYDVTQGKHVLIYNNYETVIYGLVACQFVGIFTAIRDVNYDHIKRGLRSRLYLQRNKRT